MPLTIYLIDGHALAYRAYFALTRGSSSAFTNRAGESTAGVFGFTSILLRILEQEQPEYLAVAFDTGKTFRDELYPDYKGTREKMPDDLRPQMERIRQVVDSFNIPRLEMNGYEADDVLGSVAKLAKAKGFGVKIITGDRDLLQLVEERIVVSLPGKAISDSKDYYPEDVFEYLGVKPDQVVDYKSLVGDKSDNIPGVNGIGEKTAMSLLRDFGTLEGIYTNLDKVSESVRKKLENGKDSANLSKSLATIITDLNIQLDFEQARFETFEPSKIESLFRELEFRSLMNRLVVVEQKYGKIKSGTHQLNLFETKDTTGNIQIEIHPSEQKVEVVNSGEKLERLVNEMTSAKMIALDTETTSTDQMQAELVGIACATSMAHGYYIPVGHRPELGTQLDKKIVIGALRKPLVNSRIPIIGHNLKYDFIVMARNGLRVGPLMFDTMIAEWLTRPDSRNLGLKNLSWVCLDQRMVPIEELIGKGKNQITMAEVSVEKAASYASADVTVIFQLMPVLQKDLDQCQATRLMREIEMPLVSVLADMEMAGIQLDVLFLNKMSGEMGERLHQIEEQIYHVAGAHFNINSPQQLSEVLFDRLKIQLPDRTQKTASGFYSTAADVLEMLRGKHEIVGWILEYRELAKLKSTYIDALPLQVNPVTGRVHTSYNQTGSVTGRIASSNPNLQNIPVRTELGRQVRQAFISDQGHYLLSIDYSQIELRIVAHISKDLEMLQAFKRKEDIHTATAAAIYGIPQNKVSKEQRRHAKAINFGLIYGMTPFGLTRTTDLTLAEAENFVEAYFKQFPGVKDYLNQARVQAYEQGYVETMMGRRRYFPGLRTQRNQNIRNREEREAINAPIQGTAADIMKIAMIRIPPALSEARLSAKMLLQVHDELVLECDTEEVKETAKLVQREMESALQLSIPLTTDARYGKNWDALIPVL